MSLNSPFRKGKKHVEEAPYVPSLGTAVFDSHYKTVEYSFSPRQSAVSSSSSSSNAPPTSVFSCGSCGKEASEKIQLLPCKNCHRRYHCNLFCQIADWSKHHGKSVCQLEKHTANFITAVTNLEPSNAEMVLQCLEKLHTKYEKHKPHFPSHWDVCEAVLIALRNHHVISQTENVQEINDLRSSNVIVHSLGLITLICQHHPLARAAFLSFGAAHDVINFMCAYPTKSVYAIEGIAAIAALLRDEKREQSQENDTPSDHNAIGKRFFSGTKACGTVIEAVKVHGLYDITTLHAIDALCVDDPTNRITFKVMGTLDLLRAMYGNPESMVRFDMMTRDKALETVNRIRGIM